MIACFCGGIFEFLGFWLVGLFIGGGGSAAAGIAYNKCRCKKH